MDELQKKFQETEAETSNHASSLEQVNQALLQFGERFQHIENQYAHSLQSLAYQLAVKVSTDALEELHERLDEVIDYLHAKYQSQDNLSRITETVADRSRAGSGEYALSTWYWKALMRYRAAVHERGTILRAALLTCR